MEKINKRTEELSVYILAHPTALGKVLDSRMPYDRAGAHSIFWRPWIGPALLVIDENEFVRRAFLHGSESQVENCNSHEGHLFCLCKVTVDNNQAKLKNKLLSMHTARVCCGQISYDGHKYLRRILVSFRRWNVQDHHDSLVLDPLH